MNDEIRDIIINITRSPTVLACLQLAELIEIDDYFQFSQSNINILEKYIQSRTSVMDLNSRKIYLTEEFLYYPDKFVFTPGMRNRLLKAAKVISGNMYGVNNCESNKSDTTESHVVSSDNNYNSTANLDQLFNFSYGSHVNSTVEDSRALNFCKFDNQFLSSPTNCPGPVKVEPFDRTRHLNYIDKYYTDISKNARKNFADCVLEPRVHFEITIPEDDPTNLMGLFHCNLCFDRRKLPTTIKFRFSKYNSVVYTNINSHLKIHFQYIGETPEKKRLKLSKSGELETAVINQEVNGFSGDSLPFES